MARRAERDHVLHIVGAPIGNSSRVMRLEVGPALPIEKRCRFLAALAPAARPPPNVDSQIRTTSPGSRACEAGLRGPTRVTVRAAPQVIQVDLPRRVRPTIELAGFELARREVFE
jgi:hypothetical protein